LQLFIAGKSILRRVRGVGPVREVAIEPLLRSFRSAGIDLPRIKPPALLLILEQVVGSRYGLELRLRLLVARMQIGMEFACQFFLKASLISLSVTDRDTPRVS